MKNRIPASLLFIAALALPALAAAQLTPVTTQTLINGLNTGRPVTITTPLASGYLQTVSFVPSSGPMPQAQAAQYIQRAERDLAARGIAKPTALQIAVTLIGGTLATPDGDVQVPGLLPKASDKAKGKSKSKLKSVQGNENLQVFYNGPYV
jgi:hypothetical protein